MALKLSEFHVAVRNGGFIVDVVLEKGNVDGNPQDNIHEQYIVPTYAKLMKAVKEEFKDFKPLRKDKENV